MADDIEDAVRIPFGDIPGFPRRTQELAGHAGQLVAGRLEGVEVAAMQGRFHLYEGWQPADVALPVRALAALGAETMLLTNAAGGIRPGFQPGDLMLMADHINLMLRNPLIGRTVPGEERFPDMSDPYDAGFRASPRRSRGSCASPWSRACTRRCWAPATRRRRRSACWRRLGADAVGMSTVPEVLVARAIGMKCLGISCITNLAAGLSDERLSHQEVMEVGARVRDRLAALVRGVLPRVAGLNRASEAAA